MKPSEILGVTLNVSILAVFYTVLGGIFSYLLYYLVDEHTDEWEQKSFGFQIVDVMFELSFIGIFAFWITYIIRDASPIIPISKDLDVLVDTYISGVFFTFSMFIFLNDLSSKIRFIYDKLFKSKLDAIIGTEGSILDGSLRSRKMERE